jgi:hypothetical protein
MKRGMKRPWAWVLGIYAAVAAVFVTAVLIPDYLYRRCWDHGDVAWMFFRLPPAYFSIKGEGHLWPDEAWFEVRRTKWLGWSPIEWYHRAIAVAYWLVFLTPLLGWLRTRKLYFLVGLGVLLVIHVAYIWHFLTTFRWS